MLKNIYFSLIFFILIFSHTNWRGEYSYLCGEKHNFIKEKIRDFGYPSNRVVLGQFRYSNITRTPGYKNTRFILTALIYIFAKSILRYRYLRNIELTCQQSVWRDPLRDRSRSHIYRIPWPLDDASSSTSLNERRKSRV